MLSQVGEEGKNHQMLDGVEVATETPNAPAPGGEPVPLSSLIGHGVRLQWYEAVAVIQEICERRAKTQPPETIPDLEHTWIGPDGRVSVSPGTIESESSATQPAAALGQLLQTLVDEMGLPIQLDLVVQAAMSPTPPHMTVNEFSEALVRFERPNRALALQEVYGRRAALAPEVRSAAVPVAAPSPPPPPPPPTKVVQLAPPHDAMDIFLPERAHGRLVRFPVIPVAVAACVIVAAAGVAAWGLPGGQAEPPSAPPAPPAFAEAQKAASLVPQAWISAADPETAGNSLGLDIIPGAGLRDDPAPTTRASGLSSRFGSSAPAARLAPTAAPSPAAPPAGNATRAAEPSPAPPPSTLTRDVVVDERLEAPPSEPTGPVFSSSDEDVVPPVLFQPKLSLEPPAGVPLSDLSVFDVLVSDDGRVETIRLAGPARDYREAMILSAIKMWRFRPATKDGRPVRYMKRIWLSVSAAATIVG